MDDVSHHYPAQETSGLGRGLLAAMLGNPAGRVMAADGTALDHPAMLAEVTCWHHRLATLPAGQIAICGAKRPEIIAAMLAVLACGRAYAPLDPAHPDGRLETVLDMIAPAGVIVDTETARRLGPWSARSSVDLLVIGQEGPPVTLPAPVAGQTAAILHTSGSTGAPKQVRIGAAALDIFATWVRTEFALGPQDCLLSHAPLAFDLSFLDVIAGLSAGASLALADTDTARNGERLLQLIDRAGVSVVQAAPSALALMTGAAAGRVCPGVRAVLFAGEPMPAPVLQAIFATFPNARVVNIYGCTETNDTFLYDVPRHHTPDPLPLGHALPYVDYIIVADDGAPVAAGEEGELWLRCPTTMQGYSDPDLNRAAFAKWQGARWFRSRDRVRLEADGMVHFLGRADTVQKINGNRIDLSEVEGWLAKMPGVSEIAAFVTDRDGARQLECAIATDGRVLRALDLRLHAMQSLPAYAIPRRFAVQSHPLPKNSNGKICRRSLAAL